MKAPSLEVNERAGSNDTLGYETRAQARVYNEYPDTKFGRLAHALERDMGRPLSFTEQRRLRRNMMRLHKRQKREGV